MKDKQIHRGASLLKTECIFQIEGFPLEFSAGGLNFKVFFFLELHHQTLGQPLENIQTHPKVLKNKSATGHS